METSIVKRRSSYKLSGGQHAINILNKVLRMIGNILFIIFVTILLVSLFYSIYTKKTGQTDKAPLVSAYVIISPSMVPTINVLDAVVAVRPNIERLKKGDIITFNSSDVRYTGLTVTHRILKVVEENNNRVFKTKGDNNTTPDDSKVLANNIFGKVILVIPWLGYLQYILTKPYGWLLLVVLPCVGLIVYDIMKIKKQIVKSKKKTTMKFKDVEVKKKSSSSSTSKSKSKKV